MEVVEVKDSEEQREFSKRAGCVDQIFVIMYMIIDESGIFSNKESLHLTQIILLIYSTAYRLAGVLVWINTLV